MLYGYMRVSTKEQNLDRQEFAIKEYAKKNGIKIDNIFKDKKSGKNFDRIEYQSMKQIIKLGDTLIIKELDRLGRDMDGIKAEWNELVSKGIQIVIIDNEMLSTKGKSDLEQKLISNIVFELLSYMAQKEREKLSIRVKEGMARVKAKGKVLGRRKTTIADIPDLVITCNELFKEHKINKTKFASMCKITRTTLDKYLGIIEGENK